MKLTVLLSFSLICAAVLGFWLHEPRSSSFSARVVSSQTKEDSDFWSHIELIGARDGLNGPIRDSLKLKIFEGECKATSQPLASLPVKAAAAGGHTADLAPGKYCLVAEAPGYLNKSQTFVVSAATKELVVRMALACEQPDKVTQQCRNDYARKQYPEAQKSCRQAVLCNPEEADNLLRLAKLSVLNGSYTNALEFVNQAIERNSMDWDSFYVRAKIYIHLRNDEQASDDIETAIKLCGDLSSDCADLHHLKGQIFKQEALAPNAVDHCKLWEGAVREFGISIKIAGDQELLKEYRENLANASTLATKAGCKRETRSTPSQP